MHNYFTIAPHLTDSNEFCVFGTAIPRLLHHFLFTSRAPLGFDN
jgi:hypothetical protein